MLHFRTVTVGVELFVAVLLAVDVRVDDVLPVDVFVMEPLGVTVATAVRDDDGVAPGTVGDADADTGFGDGWAPGHLPMPNNSVEKSYVEPMWPPM